IYRSQHYESHAKDYAFARLSMNDHWQAGYADTVRTLERPEALARPTDGDGIRTFDATAPGPTGD
ncbi:MAG: DUF3734 domain-containing protein, partial [Pseudomonadota bacterium]